MYLAQKLSLLFAVTLAFLFLSMFASSSNVYAGWRCCDPKPGTHAQCGEASDQGCDACTNTEKKNPGVCGQTCTPEQVKAGTCIICDLGKVSNVCNTGGGGSFYCTVRPNPTTMNLSVGATKRVSSTLATAPKAFLSWWGSNVTYTSKDTSKATVSAWATYATAYATNITGVAVGSTSIAVRGNVDPTQSDPLPAVSCNGNVNVNIVAPLSCVPGAGCKPATGTAPVFGGNMICSLPTIAKPAEYSTYTQSYGLRCDVYNGTTLVKKNAVNTTSANPTFPQFKLSYRGTYKCSFQHCFENTTNKYCSAWGAI